MGGRQVLWGCSERWSWLGQGRRNRGTMEKELTQETDTARHLMARAQNYKLTETGARDPSSHSELSMMTQNLAQRPLAALQHAPHLQLCCQPGLGKGMHVPRSPGASSGHTHTRTQIDHTVDTNLRTPQTHKCTHHTENSTAPPPTRLRAGGRITNDFLEPLSLSLHVYADAGLSWGPQHRKSGVFEAGEQRAFRSPWRG